MGPVSGVDRILNDARCQLDRVDPAGAARIVEGGGLLIDIRPARQRAEFGEVPGALVIERNDLEWRLDPAGAHRLPEGGEPVRPVVIMCQEGYASSLAAASLLHLGRAGATDLDGGFAAWKAAGFPVLPPPGENGGSPRNP
jgi:rhodanese-related sulfurtransferase